MGYLMSHDLYLWHSPQPVTAQQAMTICHQLARSHDGVVVPDAAVLAFHQELIERFPPLETLGDDDIDDSPRNMSPDATADRVILCMGLSRASKIGPFILELAKRHRLVCFDPSTGVVRNPPPARPNGSLLLGSCDGSVIIDPGPEDLRSQLERLSRANFYACLEREEGWFVQVGIGPRAGNVPDEKFALEYREGDPDRHYRVLADGLEDAVTLFEDFAAHRDFYKTAFAWARY